MGETAGVTQDVGSDPTVSSHLYFCTFCGEEIGLWPDKDDRDDASSLVGTNKVEDLAALMAQLEESEEEDLDAVFSDCFPGWDDESDVRGDFETLR